MAYFIVIGTNNDVECVVDEIKKAHLQHNVITSGCIVEEGENLFYHWDIYNNKGDKTNESNEPIVLHDALTNQISHFKALLPADVIPNVFIVSQCFNKKRSETLQLVCDELCQIGGAMMCGLQVDVVLLGYDINKSDDVTIRPHWRILESLRGLEATNRFHTNILYINNMDYMGAATCVDFSILAKFLCYWSKIVCSGSYDSKKTVRSNVYSIGVSEYQYNFSDLNDFFMLSAEERLLNRRLNNLPSSDTQKLIDYNYYKKIDLGFYWLDGLCSIKTTWDSYCTTMWDSSKPLQCNPYSLSNHEQLLASYLNSFLQLYISEETREISYLKAEIEQKEAEIAGVTASLATYVNLPDPAQLIAAKATITQLQDEISECQEKIKIHEENIQANTFIDADEFFEKFGKCERVTEEDEEIYCSNYNLVGDMIRYVKSDKGINIMREAVERASVEDILPHNYPARAVADVGRAMQNETVGTDTSLNAAPTYTNEISEDLSERAGCLLWFTSIFNKKSKDAETDIIETIVSARPALVAEHVSKDLSEKLNKCIAVLKRVDDVREWWRRLCTMVDTEQRRRQECILLMDGEKDINNQYVANNEGYRPKWHSKSISLINMDLVRHFRDTDSYYKDMIDRFLCRWFDPATEPSKRMTMRQLIKHQVLDSLVGKFHTLKWDGTNPFIKEKLSDSEMHDIIQYNIRQSIPFVEYVRIQDSNLASNVSIGFFSNNPNIPIDATKFRKRYELGTVAITPVNLKDFVNSLCVIQVMDIPNHIDSIKDFKPKREAELNRLREDIAVEVTNFISKASTIEDKAKSIYKWLCENIEYDITEQIHDAETCWKLRSGVCQAYCELFCYMAEMVGLTADIVVGKTKNSNGEISKKKHAWIFVYTKAYDGFLIDPTWGASHINNGKIIMNDNDFTWFNVSPYWMIFTHFPDEQYWTKLEIKIEEEQFRNLPYMKPSKDNDGKDILFEAISSN